MDIAIYSVYKMYQRNNKFITSLEQKHTIMET